MRGWQDASQSSGRGGQYWAESLALSMTTSVFSEVEAVAKYTTRDHTGKPRAHDVLHDLVEAIEVPRAAPPAQRRGAGAAPRRRPPVSVLIRW
mmetsp:Transcript_115123/g.336660  ORF Transcript_115123/g.336660 Transcript_115123/m.336660 type:complete len:93 (-) Transcript_115123:14-292(-)